jgi:CDP-glucose 4,6-dehydratase
MTYAWRNRRTLVTGATGIVGSWLCEELVRREAHVVALVLDDDPQSRFFSEHIAQQCTIVRGNLSQYTDCTRVVATHDIDVIFHLGAQTLVGAALRDPLGTFESNIRGTYNLLEAARLMAPTMSGLVVASSDKAYGTAALPYTEDTALNGRHPYDVSKSCTDLLAVSYAHTYGLPVTIARCGNIYGGGDLNWSRIVPGTIRSLLDGERPVLRSDGRSIRDYVYVRDVVSAYIALAERAAEPQVAGQAFNFSPETRCSVLEIVGAIGAALGCDANPTIQATATLEIRDQTLDSSKARALLNWRAHWTLAEGLRETVSWYRRHLSARTGTRALTRAS